jgi:hypothetical protein
MRGESEKLVPQPQDASAFGLSTLKDAPIRSSTESIPEPARDCQAFPHTVRRE